MLWYGQARGVTGLRREGTHSQPARLWILGIQCGKHCVLNVREMLWCSSHGSVEMWVEAVSWSPRRRAREAFAAPNLALSVNVGFFPPSSQHEAAAEQCETP